MVIENFTAQIGVTFPLLFSISHPKMLTFCRHRQLVEKNISLSTSWSKSFNGLNGSEVIRDEKTGVEDKKKGFRCHHLSSHSQSYLVLPFPSCVCGKQTIKLMMSNKFSCLYWLYWKLWWWWQMEFFFCSQSSGWASLNQEMD